MGDEDKCVYVYDNGTARWVTIQQLAEWLKEELKPKRKPAVKKDKPDASS